MKKRIAIFPAGTEIGLEIHNALKYSTHFELFGFSSVSDHSEYVFQNHISDLPFYSDEGFLDKINGYLIAHKINYLFPAHDDVQLFLTENAKDIKAEVLTSSIDTVRICRSKLKTYEFFKEENFTPKTYGNVNEIKKYPVFVKPDVGQGSKGAELIRNKTELENALIRNEKVAICEYLPGDEYTIDCFTDYEGNLRACKLRQRKRVKSGISVNSEVLPMNDDVFEIAKAINSKLKFNGVWFFQLKKDLNNEYKLLEIAPRVSGTMGVSRNKGVNFSLLTVFNSMKIPVTIIENNYDIEVDRALISRYNLKLEYKNIYVDLDDTIINNNQINTFLMMFLYQAINLGKKIYLISRHVKSIEETLIDNRISIDLFDEIIHLKNGENKADHIELYNSIFIDDSFSERYSVALKGIPVFDLDSVECLINWKR